jgi:hypothetical protein
MQLTGIAGMFVAAFTMFLLYNNFPGAHAFFGVSLILILASLLLCAFEVYLSNKALIVQLKDIEHLVK